MRPSERPLSNKARNHVATIQDRIDYLVMKKELEPYKGKNLRWMSQEREALRWALRLAMDVWPELSIQEQYLEDRL